jgi:hypothetical protein
MWTGWRTSVPRLSRRAQILLAAALFLVAGGAAFAVSSAESTVNIPVGSYQLTGDPRQLVATVMVGLSYEITEHSAREDATTVTLTVRARRPGGSWPAVGVFVPVPITLRSDLGDRTVVDGFGSVVPQHGTYRTP